MGLRSRSARTIVRAGRAHPYRSPMAALAGLANLALIFEAAGRLTQLWSTKGDQFNLESVYSSASTVTTIAHRITSAKISQRLLRRRCASSAAGS